jgi:hypothetical protein
MICQNRPRPVPTGIAIYDIPEQAAAFSYSDPAYFFDKINVDNLTYNILIFLSFIKKNTL